jgi:hypothetical protein
VRERKKFTNNPWTATVFFFSDEQLAELCMNDTHPINSMNEYEGNDLLVV